MTFNSTGLFRHHWASPLNVEMHHAPADAVMDDEDDEATTTTTAQPISPPLAAEPV